MKNKISTSIMVIVTFSIYKLMQPNYDDPIINILIAAGIGAIIGAVAILVQHLFHKKLENKTETPSKMMKTIFTSVGILFGICILGLLFVYGYNMYEMNRLNEIKSSIWIRATSEKCVTGYSFEITNNTFYYLDKVSFKIIGKIPGRSSEYNLGFGGYDNFVSDVIMDPVSKIKTCYQVNQAVWPPGESLLLSAEVMEADLHDGEGNKIFVY